MSAALKNRDGNVVPTDVIDEFKSQVRGQVIVAGDDDYDTARRIWNALVDKHPGVILRCSGTADVADHTDRGS